jgi:hypothetical protein
MECWSIGVLEYWSAGCKNGNRSDFYSFIFDKILKSHFKDYIAACAGMTSIVFI